MQLLRVPLLESSIKPIILHCPIGVDSLDAELVRGTNRVYNELKDSSSLIRIHVKQRLGLLVFDDVDKCLRQGIGIKKAVTKA